MPTYTIEIEYLVPVQRTVQVEAATPEEACRALAGCEAWQDPSPAVLAIAEGALGSPYDGQLLPVPPPYAAAEG